MVALILAMLRARRGQAVTVWLLSALATAAAVAAPAYLGGIDRAIVAGEVANASVAERTLRISAAVEARQTGEMPRDFERLAEVRLDAPGFVAVFSAEFAAMPGDARAVSADELRRIVYRDDLCAHVVVVAGRCLIGGGETVLGEATARRLGLAPGSRIASQAATFDSTTNSFVPAGASWTMTVVGLVRPRDPAELYWGRAATLSSTAGQPGDPLFVSRYTLANTDHGNELQAFDGYATGPAITVERLPALREWLDTNVTDPSGGGPKVATALPDLIDRIDDSRAQAHRTVPLEALPLAALAWAVIVFAVTAGARARRFELGVVALRGVARPARWWLAAGETVLALLAGTPVGFLLGWLVAAVFAPFPPAVNADMLAYAAVAVLGALLAGCAIQLRTVSAPVAALLRDVERRAGRWRSLMLDVLVVVLAAVALIQLRGAGRAGLGPASGTVLAGIALLAPALVMAATGLLVARLVPTTAAGLAGRWLRRGRLVGALTALRLARRPVGHRLLVLLVIAVGSLGLAGTATATAARSQAGLAALHTGASTVLSVGDVPRGRLLRAVRAADPDGRFAMAVVPLRPAGNGLPPSLAVDSPRLAAVALWSPTYSRQPPAELARLLRPPAAEPVTFTGAQLTLDVTVEDRADTTLALRAVVAPADGGPNGQVRFGALATGRHPYTAASPGCTSGCRLVSIEVELPTYVGPVVKLRLHSVQQRAFGSGWHAPPGATVAPAADGLALQLPVTGRSDAGRILPPDAPAALPLVSTRPLPPDGAYASFDGRPVTAAVAGPATTLPRLGEAGSLVDLEYADRVATDAGLASGAEVWLAAAAPPSIVDRLAALGLTITGRHTVGEERAALDRHGAALALRFYTLAGLFAVVLGAAGLIVTTVTGSSADLEALRPQGLPARVARRVEAWTPVSVVLVALLAGTTAATIAWWSVADRLPVLAGSPNPTPGAAELARPLWMLLGAGAALITTALTATALRRRRG